MLCEFFGYLRVRYKSKTLKMNKIHRMNKNLLKIFLMMTISLTFNSCTEKQKFDKGLELEKKRINMTTKNLIGNTYEWKYKESTYHITLKSDSTVHWKLTEGNYPGPTEETDKYVSSQIDENKFFISWVEESGLGVYSVLDFETMNLYTQGSQDGQLYVNPGKIKKVD